MKRAFSILSGLGVVIVLFAALLKELHIKGGKPLIIIGICVLLVAMIFYFLSIPPRNKPMI